MIIHDLKPGNNALDGEDFQRLEFPKRIAIEKGMFPDEALAVCQLSGGSGVVINNSVDGKLYDPYTGIYKNDKQAIGNIIINRSGEVIRISGTPEEYTKQEFEISGYTYLYKRFEKLLKDISTLIVNGVEYTPGYHYYIKEQPNDLGSYNGYIQWISSVFKLDDKDEIYLKV